MRLALAHLRYGLLLTVRIPIMVVSVLALPSLSFLFFALPYISHDRVAATVSTLAMAVFAAVLIFLFQFGVGIAEERQSPWDPYVRTLPVRPWQRITGQLGVAVPFVVGALVPLLVVAKLTTPAGAPIPRVLAGVGALLVGSLPLALIGVGLGNALPSRAAVAVANLLMLPLAFLGGLFIPPDFLPHIVKVISPFAPTRGWFEMVGWAVLGSTSEHGGVNPVSLIAWCGWLVIGAMFAVWAFRRAETARYR